MDMFAEAAKILGVLWTTIAVVAAAAVVAKPGVAEAAASVEGTLDSGQQHLAETVSSTRWVESAPSKLRQQYLPSFPMGTSPVCPAVASSATVPSTYAPAFERCTTGD